MPSNGSLDRKDKVMMKEQRVRFSCHSCGKVVGCSPGEPPCGALEGWLTVAHWEGRGAVAHYNFCSFSCLKSWADNYVPKVPEVFLESFEEDET